MQKDELFQRALKFLHVLENIGIEIVIVGDTHDVQYYAHSLLVPHLVRARSKTCLILV
jgi:hypothetical protein